MSFSMLAVIRIARGSVATDAFSQCSLWILTSYVFSLRSEQRAGLHKSDDTFCWFSFQGIQIDGGFCSSGLSTKPLAAQTLDAQADNMRLCTPLRCKKWTGQLRLKVLFSEDDGTKSAKTKVCSLDLSALQTRSKTFVFWKLVFFGAFFTRRVCKKSLKSVEIDLNEVK